MWDTSCLSASGAWLQNVNQLGDYKGSSCPMGRTLKPPHSRMSELDQTRCTLLSSLLGLRGGARELPFMLGAEHLTHPFHPCSILGLGQD